MNHAAVFHHAGGHYCYPKNQNELIINLKTGYEVERVWLVSGDPFDAGIAGGAEKWTGTTEEIFFKKDLKDQRWWTTTVKPPYKRLKYYFILKAEGKNYYYFENGFLTKEQIEEEGRMLQYFNCPWMNESDISCTPEWVQHTVWYQIFPERFCNGNPKRNRPDTKSWECRPVTNREFFGGDLEGIISKLDYLKNLGITGIYLTPIFKSPSAHKYDTTDYYQIDETFGDRRVFKLLVEQAHRHGIRVMIDMVFNHCGSQFSRWCDVVEKGPESPYYDWFMVNQWPFPKEEKSTRDKRFYSFAFMAGMPKFNTNNPEVVEYLNDVCTYWVNEFDVDGLRFDVGNEVSHTFLRTLRTRLKKLKPDIYLLGEIWHDASAWLDGTQYDAVMNYPLTESINDFWLNDHMTRQDFAYMINRSYTMYREQNNQVLFNLLDSHDTNRLFTRTGENMDAFLQQLTVLFTMPGSPCIYYGTEIAMPGGHDPDCRRCMPWDKIENGDYELSMKMVRSLIHIRKNYSCCISPYFHFPAVDYDPRVIVYEKLSGFGGKNVIILNCSEETIRVDRENMIFSWKCRDGVMEPGGIAITYTDKIR